MFGYIIANKPELKIREFDVYQGYYCGLCKSIKEKYGNIKRLTLNYDLTFVAILLSSLDLNDPAITNEACILHPTKKKKIYKDDYTRYCADMTIFFSYYKCKDDWIDEHKTSAYLLKNYLQHSFMKVIATYPEKCKKMIDALEQLDDLEKNQEQNIDTVSNCFGEVMAEIMCYKNEEWHSTLRNLGFALGKFIYLMDAFDDLEEDKNKNEYNVFLKNMNHENFEDWVYEVLSSQMALLLEAYEELPIVENDGILRNIICSGVWTKYQELRLKGENDGSL